MKRIIVMVLKNIIFVPYYWIMLNWYAAVFVVFVAFADYGGVVLVFESLMFFFFSIFFFKQKTAYEIGQ